ncbi:iron ABC transporter substrate-binding protein [Alkalispirochaeta sphaeroplastigenens]|uniref:Iron ABC transporter substrate-binding protein n=1 Tax=Alkalispirochaeta sphaeroplastigenens TaxID=1187066 RepID=A0A2S4K113_9SPIO|nr:ABC transporter substrate-binding protein [Alkalispirochaeta sphaeroplastigenens]POR05460.1 iron ABC transporter substrate-binding protein [Alkalispirochaeta sphaeroplastigenens]
MKKAMMLGLVALMSATALFAGGRQEAGQRITAYTTLDEELARNVFAAFTRETGIQVDWVRLSTGEAVARIEAERANPQASIWYGGVGLGHIEAKNKGLTTPYNSPAATMPEQFRDPDGYWSGIYAGPLAFASNNNVMERLGIDAPDSWEALLDPRLRNQVQMANPGSSGTSYNVLATMVQVHGEEGGFEYMERLDRNITQYTRSGSAPGRNVAIGEVGVAIGYAHDIVRLIAEGYPMTMTVPDGTGFEVAAVSLIANGPEAQQEAARKLFDWALGETAAKLYAEQFVVPFVDVPLAPGAVPIREVNVIDQDDEWAAQERARLVDKWNDTIGASARTE